MAGVAATSAAATSSAAASKAQAVAGSWDTIGCILAHMPKAGRSTVAMADRIYLLAEGWVEHIGTPDELARGSADFRELVSGSRTPP